MLLDFITKKNQEVIDELRREHGMANALMDILKDEIEEKLNVKEQETRQETMAAAIRNVMESLGIGVEKAMDTLKIPPEQRSVYAGLVRRM